MNNCDIIPKKIKNVVAGIFYKNGSVLIMKRAKCENYAGWWEFPGGKVEKGETYEDALKRELREEINIESIRLKFITSTTQEYDTFTVNLNVYHILTWQGSIQLTVHDGMKWVSLEEFSKVEGLLPADIRIAGDLIQYFNTLN